MLENLPASAGDTRDAVSISGSGRSPEVGNGNPLMYSFVENSMNTELQFTELQSRTRLSEHAHSHTHTHTHTHTLKSKVHLTENIR